MVLLRGLPSEARLARPAGDEQPWTTHTELLALLLEEVSVLAAEQRRKEPITFPRPRSRTPVPAGYRAALAEAARLGRVKVVTDG